MGPFSLNPIATHPIARDRKGTSRQIYKMGSENDFAANFLANFLSSILKDLTSAAAQLAINSLRGSKINIKDELEKLGKELRSMHSFLREVEHNQATGSGGLTDWAEQVQETSRKVEVLEQMVYCGRGLAWDKSWSSIAQNYMATHLEKIKNEFESDIPKRRERYQCQKIAPREDDEKLRDQWQWQFPQSHNVNDELVGAEKNEDMLTGWLLHETNVDTSRNIAISICGMGGLGKTALAMKVYGKSKIKECFDCSAWVSISRSCSLNQLMGSIIMQVTNSAIGPDYLQSSSREDLLTLLQNSLHGKRYVIVLDGVSSRNACDELSHFLLQNGATGSRVLLTTRDRRIASSLSTERHVLNLQLLSEEEAWSLFCNKAFRSSPCPKDLEDWARKIVAECGGLPLAIVTFAGVMSTKDWETLTWKRFYDSMGAEFHDNEMLVDMSRVLMLDFDGLPSNLKLCYLYCCGIFPVNYVIKKNWLIRLWVAEGLVEERQGITMEEVAEDYLDRLVRANLIQVAIADEMGRTKACRVHVLMREISLAATRDKPFTVLDERETRVDDTTRRLSIQKSIKKSPIFLPKGKKKDKAAATLGENVLSRLRSLLFFSGDKPSAAAFVAMSRNFMLLKVLELRDLPITHLPDAVADLFNLRYLSLRRTDVKDLPKHIDKLQMLETLDVKGTRVAYIPRRIRKLTRLRHLLIDQPRLHTKDDIIVALTTKCHSWVWSLKDLLTLKTVDVDPLIVEDIAEMVHLRRLGLANLEEKRGFDLCESLSKMRELLSLSIKAAPDEALMLESLTAPPPHLQKLVLDGRMQRLPIWFGALSSLTHLYLMHSRLDDEESNPLPLLGKLDNLLHLTLRMAYTGSHLCFVAKQFRHLKSLNIEALGRLSELEVEEDGLPSLSVLHLSHCRYLETIEGVDKLPSVCLIYLQEMPDALAYRLGGDSRVKKSNGWKSVCNSIPWPSLLSH